MRKEQAEVLATRHLRNFPAQGAAGNLDGACLQRMAMSAYGLELFAAVIDKSGDDAFVSSRCSALHGRMAREASNPGMAQSVEWVHEVKSSHCEQR